MVDSRCNDLYINYAQQRRRTHLECICFTIPHVTFGMIRQCVIADSGGVEGPNASSAELESASRSRFNTQPPPDYNSVGQWGHNARLTGGGVRTST